jgi:two-component system, NtrC family, response regulator HupR/HoxA
MEDVKSIFVDGRTVLFVDDEEKVLLSLKRALEDEPYNMLFAIGGHEALRIISEQDVHVIVTDMKMPEMDGLELLRLVKEKRPNIVRNVLSGFSDSEMLQKVINKGEIYRFVTKPWNTLELKNVVLQALEYYELCGERQLLLDFFEQWINGKEPEEPDVAFLKELVHTRHQNMKEWCDRRQITVANAN